MKLDSNVLFAFLFGSRAKGTANKFSDTDIALYLSPKIDPSKYFDLRLKYTASLPIKVERDVIILNESSPLLAYEVVSNGKPIFIRSKKAMIDFKARAFLRYFDTQALRSVQYSAMNERIKGGRIGYFKGDGSIKIAKVRDFSRKIKRARKAH